MMNEQPQKLEKPRWVGRAFVGVVVLAILLPFLWVKWLGRSESQLESGTAAARATEFWELCYSQTLEACRRDHLQGPCESCNPVTLLDLRTMLVRAKTPDGQTVHIEQGLWVQRDRSGRVVAEGTARLDKVGDGVWHGTYTDPRNDEAGSLLLRRK